MTHLLRVIAPLRTRRARAAAVFVSAIIVAAGCTDSTEPRMKPASAAFDHYYGNPWDPSRCTGYYEPYTYYNLSGGLVRCTQQWSIENDIDGRAQIWRFFRGPIHVTFSEPVYHLVVESINATYLCGGSYGSVWATFASGRRIEVPFENADPGDCGSDNIGGHLRLRVPGDDGVTSIVITEMLPRSWVMDGFQTVYSRGEYSVWFDRIGVAIDPEVDKVICPPVGEDPIVNDIQFRQVSDSLLKLSNLSDPQRENRRERLAFVWRNSATGTLRFDISPIVGNACDISVASPPDAGLESLVGVVHTHPTYAGENVKVACGNAKARPYNPRANGGGSNEDWKSATSYYFADVYAVAPQYIHRLDHELRDRSMWGKNPVSWKRDVATGCPTR